MRRAQRYGRQLQGAPGGFPGTPQLERTAPADTGRPASLVSAAGGSDVGELAVTDHPGRALGWAETWGSGWPPPSADQKAQGGSGCKEPTHPWKLRERGHRAACGCRLRRQGPPWAAPGPAGSVLSGLGLPGKVHRLAAGDNERTSRGWRPEVAALANSVPGEGLLPGGRRHLLTVSSYKDTAPVTGAPPSWPHLNLTPPRGPASKYHLIGVGAST